MFIVLQEEAQDGTSNSWGKKIGIVMASNEQYVGKGGD